MSIRATFHYFQGMECDMYSFYRIPKLLFTSEYFKNLSCEAKVLYGLMLDRMSLSIKNRWFDEEDRAYIFFSVEEIMEMLNCGRNKAVNCLKELDQEKGIGLIEKRRIGLGKTNVIYVKNFSLTEYPDEPAIFDSEETPENVAEKLKGVDGILVPGGFGTRGTEGKIEAIRYAREEKIPFLGICLGMQIAAIAFARGVLGYEDANSTEFAPDSKHPVIALMPDQEDVEDLGGTLRLGSYPCVLAEGSRSYELFGKKEIQERHRHRYEVNNAFRKELDEKGMSIVGTSPDAHIVEMIEIAGHPFFVGTQGHPEFKSRPNHAHPLFRGFVQAAVDKKTAEEAAMKG